MKTVNVRYKEGTSSFLSNEAYKTLRTNLEFSGADNRVIVITSCSPGEGKSVVSFNLARSLAQGGKRVLFIDADMRRSRFLGAIYSDSPFKGLSHFLSGQAELADVILQVNIRNLFAIFAGPNPPDPAELLGSPLFSGLINDARTEYDFVIIDTPPLGSVIDAAIAAKVAGSAAIVVEEGVTRRKFIRVIKEQLDKADCKMLGIILNKVEQKKGGYYNDYYGEYYNREY